MVHSIIREMSGLFTHPWVSLLLAFFCIALGAFIQMKIFRGAHRAFETSTGKAASVSDSEYNKSVVTEAVSKLQEKRLKAEEALVTKIEERMPDRSQQASVSLSQEMKELGLSKKNLEETLISVEAIEKNLRQIDKLNDRFCTGSNLLRRSFRKCVAFFGKFHKRTDHKSKGNKKGRTKQTAAQGA